MLGEPGILFDILMKTLVSHLSWVWDLTKIIIVVVVAVVFKNRVSLV